ncbi:MAG TPA: ABC transporter substrate-binding protein [Gammaproteobacteria bacterium]|nr:ABC transporter substrate-binding protein [Gammaproteobacteria bacterium]
MRNPMAGWRRCMLLLVLGLSACSRQPWNDPYPASQARQNILYLGFQERPKHLDPARAYSSNEYQVIAQIYEPPLEYQYLKRPYTLVPLAAASMPTRTYLDAKGHRLPSDAPVSSIAYTVYHIHIRPHMHYQPHPAFARTPGGKPLYMNLKPARLAGIHTLGDFRHTGTREVTAADFVYEIKRLADPKVQSPIYGLMSEYIVGLKKLAKTLRKVRQSPGGQGYVDLDKYPLPGAQVTGRYSYKITIRGKYPQFRYWLAMPFFAPMPHEAVQFYSQPGLADRNISLDWYPVGSGPYMMTINNPNRQMVLVRNPDFHEERYPSVGEPGDAKAGLLADAGKRLPFIRKIIFTLEPESIPYWNKFLQGYYDVSGVTSDSFDQAIRIGSGGELALTGAMRRKHIKMETAVAPSIYYMGFNMLDPVVGGYSERARKLRQAISIALNYEDYISIFLNGQGVAAQGPIPPGIFGYQKGKDGIDPYVYNWTSNGPQRKAIAVAKRLLAQAGYPDGRDAKTGAPLLLHLDTPGGGPDAKAQYDWLRKQFGKIDIQLDIRDTDYNRFQDKMQRGTEQLFMWGWNADYPDPENFLFLLYGPNGKVDHNGENAANYNNPRFNALFDRMKNMSNGPARMAVVHKMLEIVWKDAPWVWGYYPKTISLYHNWYGNAKPNLMANNNLKYKRIDPVLRARERDAWNRPIWWPLVLAGLLVVVSMVPASYSYWRRTHKTAHTGKD